VIRKRRKGLQVQVFAGRDPVTGRKWWLGAVATQLSSDLTSQTPRPMATTATINRAKSRSAFP
jgi:hypothetical protein